MNLSARQILHVGFTGTGTEKASLGAEKTNLQANKVHLPFLGDDSW